MKQYKDIKVKMTNIQHSKVKASADELDISIQDFVRFTLLGFNGQGKVPHLSKLLTTSSRMASNLNQATKEINSDKYYNNLDNKVISDIRDSLISMTAEVSKLRADLRALAKYDAYEND